MSDIVCFCDAASLLNNGFDIATIQGRHSSSKLLFRLEAAFFTRRVTSCRASNILSDDVDDNDDDVGDEEDSTSAGKSEDEDRKRQ